MQSCESLVSNFLEHIHFFSVADNSPTVADIPPLSQTFPPLLKSVDIQSCCMMSMYHKQNIIHQFNIFFK